MVSSSTAHERVVATTAVLAVLAVLAVAVTGAGAGFLDAIVDGAVDFVKGHDVLADVAELIAQFV